MGSLDKRLLAVEMGLIENLIVGARIKAEIQEMVGVLRTSEDIEPSLYEKVVRIMKAAGYIEGDGDGA
jgi:hypothetical protein